MILGNGKRLFDGFEGYRTPTSDDYRHLLTEGLVVPDTNVLLNLYRYNAQARGDQAIYMFSKGGDWQSFGFTQVPLAVVMGDLPDTPQVRAYRARSERPGDTTWMRALVVSQA